MTINGISKTTNFGRPSFATSKIDWHLFQEECSKFVAEFTFEFEDINSSYNRLIHSIHESLEKAGASKHSGNKIRRKTPALWWDDECNFIIANKRNLFKEFKYRPTLDNLNKYLQAGKDASKIFAKKKKSSFQQFCSSLSPDTPISKVWRYIRSFSNRYQGNPNNTMINEKEFNEAFNKIAPLTPPSSPSTIDLEELNNIPFTRRNSDDIYLVNPFSITEYKAAILSLKTKSAPGPDLISNKIIKKFPTELHYLILSLFNYMFTNSTYPHQWNSYFTIFIPKPGKKSALRPISLANNLHKVFERLINKRIEWWTENNNILNKSQFGFRRGLSCSDNIATLISDIKTANNSQLLTGTVFLDLIGAFDNVIPEILLTILSKFGLPTVILDFIKSTTARRDLTGFAAGINLQQRQTSRGLPQGSILSPILFNLYVSLAHSCIPEEAKILSYADDIAIYCSDANLETIMNILNSALTNLNHHLKILGLSIAPLKSSYTVFSTLKTRNLNIMLKRCHIKPKIMDQLIPFSTSTRYLGVHLDPELNWKSHINQQKIKLLPRINILKAISGIRWGAHPNNLLTIYKGFIRPILDWGCQAFHPLDNLLYIKMCRLQYAPLRIILGMMKTTPTNVLLDINSEPPLETRWSYLTAKFLSKVIARNNHPLDLRLTHLSNLSEDDRRKLKLGSLSDTYLSYINWFNSIEKYNLPGSLGFDYQIINFVPNIDTDTGFQISSEQNIPFAFNQFLSQNLVDASFYTDGSRSEADDLVGCAVFSPDLNLEYKIRINDFCSIFEAETLAILKTVEIIRERNINKSLVFSDSLSVLSCLCNPIINGKTHPWILRIRKSLFECSNQGLDIRIIWIPSHKGIEGNERADTLAKESLRSLDPFQLSKCHYTNLYSKFKNISLKRSIDILKRESTFKGSRYFNHKDSILSPPWFQQTKESLSRPIISLISRIRSYHTCAHSHLFDKDILTSSVCPCGHTNQDLNHIFFSCPKFTNLSDNLISSIYRIQPGIDLDIPILAFSNNLKIYKLLHNFVSQAEINI